MKQVILDSRQENRKLPVINQTNYHVGNEIRRIQKY